MQHYRIGSARQLRFALVEDDDSAEPEEIWDAVPEASRREVLARLGELLRRWFISQERQP
jgi:hypothetical protein